VEQIIYVFTIINLQRYICFTYNLFLLILNSSCRLIIVNILCVAPDDDLLRSKHVVLNTQNKDCCVDGKMT
jgi:hypothetical protein